MSKKPVGVDTPLCCGSVSEILFALGSYADTVDKWPC
jgi:hypothetical protein